MALPINFCAVDVRDGSMVPQTLEAAATTDINYMTLPRCSRVRKANCPQPVCHHPNVAGVLCLLWFALGACSLRTVPPIKFVPLLGAEKKIATTEVLSRALKDRDVAVRAQAIELLAVLSQSERESTKKEVANVFGAALKDRDPGIRLQVIEKLGRMEEKYGNKYLFSAVRDPNPFVREKVLSVLSNREADRLAQEAARLAAEAAPPPTP